jgi:hypothetical protein
MKDATERNSTNVLTIPEMHPYVIVYLAYIRFVGTGKQECQTQMLAETSAQLILERMFVFG